MIETCLKADNLTHIIDEKDEIINNLLEKMEKNSSEIQKMNEKIKDQNEITKKNDKSFKCSHCSLKLNLSKG